MSKAKFEAAKELIQAGKYQEARKMLEGIDHPRAQVWLENLDKLERSKKPASSAKPKSQSSRTPQQQKPRAKPQPKKLRGRGPLLALVALVLIAVLGAVVVLVVLPLLDDDGPTANLDLTQTSVARSQTDNPSGPPAGGAFPPGVGDSTEQATAAVTDEPTAEVMVETEEPTAVVTQIVTDEPTEPVEPEITPTPEPATPETPPTATLTPVTRLSQAFIDAEDVNNINAMNLQEGDEPTFGFEFLVVTTLSVAEGANTQETADRILALTFDTLDSDAVDLTLTLDDGVATATEYAWSNRRGDWRVTRAFTLDELAPAFLQIEGVNSTEALSVTPGELENSGFEVFVSVSAGVASGFNTQETAQAMLETIYSIYETQEVEFLVILAADNGSNTSYRWSNLNQEWTVEQSGDPAS